MSSLGEFSVLYVRYPTVVVYQQSTGSRVKVVARQAYLSSKNAMSHSDQLLRLVNLPMTHRQSHYMSIQNSAYRYGK